MKEALLYVKSEGKTKCNLCSHRCMISEGKRGICGVRENRNGVLYALNYGKAIASNVDPMEKKPFFHFLPGSEAFSISTAGCNFRCRNCQNWEISQGAREMKHIPGEEIPPEEVVRLAQEYGCKNISYTYTEPTIFLEYAYDTSKIAKQKKIKNNFVTNGYMTKEALDLMAPYLDAANVDVKGSDKFYREICSAKLEPVLETIRNMKKKNIWVEITTLIIPTLSDSEGDLRQIAEFIKDAGVEIPWHISRFHPDYLLTDIPKTPLESIERARKIGLDAGLRYVYSGNIPGDNGENTYCYNCGELLIRRVGFDVLENKITDSKCFNCCSKIDGVFK